MCLAPNECNEWNLTGSIGVALQKKQKGNGGKKRDGSTATRQSTATRHTTLLGSVLIPNRITRTEALDALFSSPSSRLPWYYLGQQSDSLSEAHFLQMIVMVITVDKLLIVVDLWYESAGWFKENEEKRRGETVFRFAFDRFKYFVSICL
jgi:hypothetical protein